MIGGILFDKDGTLLDFNATWLPPYRAAAAYLASQFPAGPDCRTLLQIGGYESATQSWQTNSPLAAGSNRTILALWSAAVGRLSAEQHARCTALLTTAVYSPVVADLRACLEVLGRRNIRLGLATMDDEANARRMIGALELDGVFDFVCGADSGYGEKPQPGMLTAFCRTCGLQPEATMMVGDSPVDMQMGRNAGARMCVGVVTGAHSRAVLTPYADRVLEHIGQIDALLEAVAADGED